MIGNEDAIGKTLLGYVSYVTGKVLIVAYDQTYPGRQWSEPCRVRQL
jgi:hypothetical protein